MEIKTHAPRPDPRLGRVSAGKMPGVLSDVRMAIDDHQSLRN